MHTGTGSLLGAHSIPPPPPHIYNSHSAKKVKLPEEWHLKLTSGLHVGSHAQAGSGFLNLRPGPTQPTL